jgi:hypothetical protein
MELTQQFRDSVLADVFKRADGSGLALRYVETTGIHEEHAASREDLWKILSFWAEDGSIIRVTPDGDATLTPRGLRLAEEIMARVP